MSEDTTDVGATPARRPRASTLDVLAFVPGSDWPVVLHLEPSCTLTGLRAALDAALTGQVRYCPDWQAEAIALPSPIGLASAITAAPRAAPGPLPAHRTVAELPAGRCVRFRATS